MQRRNITISCREEILHCDKANNNNNVNDRPNLYLQTFLCAVVSSIKEIMSKKGLRFPVQVDVGLSCFHHHCNFFPQLWNILKCFPFCRGTFHLRWLKGSSFSCS